jgi:hypothetical protein
VLATEIVSPAQATCATMDLASFQSGSAPGPLRSSFTTPNAVEKPDSPMSELTRTPM